MSLQWWAYGLQRDAGGMLRRNVPSHRHHTNGDAEDSAAGCWQARYGTKATSSKKALSVNKHLVLNCFIYFSGSAESDAKRGDNAEDGGHQRCSQPFL